MKRKNGAIALFTTAVAIILWVSILTGWLAALAVLATIEAILWFLCSSYPFPLSPSRKEGVQLMGILLAIVTIAALFVYHPLSLTVTQPPIYPTPTPCPCP